MTGIPDFNGQGNKTINILVSGWMRSIVVQSNEVDNEVHKDCNNVQAPLLEESSETDILSGEKGPEGELDHVVMIPGCCTSWFRGPNSRESDSCRKINYAAN